MIIPPRKQLFLELPQNSFHDGDSHKIANSHEISFIAATLTKYQDILPRKHCCKPAESMIFMRVIVTNSYHKNNMWR